MRCIGRRLLLVMVASLALAATSCDALSTGELSTDDFGEAIELGAGISSLFEPLATDLKDDPDPSVQPAAEAAPAAERTKNSGEDFAQDFLVDVVSGLDPGWRETETARKAIDNLIENDPRDPSAQAARAVIEVEAGENPTAAKELSRSLYTAFPPSAQDPKKTYLNDYMILLFERLPGASGAKRDRLLAEYCAQANLWQETYDDAPLPGPREETIRYHQLDCP